MSFLFDFLNKKFEKLILPYDLIGEDSIEGDSEKKLFIDSMRNEDEQI